MNEVKVNRLDVSISRPRSSWKEESGKVVSEQKESEREREKEKEGVKGPVQVDVCLGSE